MNILKQLEKGIISQSEEETQEIARQLAKEMPEDHILALRGDLGAGKTTFVKGLAEAWDIKEVVTSPTYTLYTIYEGTRQLLHMDAYRMDNADAMESLMIEEFLKSPFCLAMEWPEKVEDWLPEDAWHLYLEITPEHHHKLRLVR
jgi:tRNA threonylcarbamoyladenosine biosynthesis protein TsaE